ncbi:hypothetical protein LCGC14_1432980, partial [marine sediment metagenome]
AFAVHEFGLNVQPRQHVVDHWPAAMNDHWVHTHLPHQRDITGEFIHRLIAAHRMTAQLDDHGGIGIALQKGQGLAEGTGSGDPVAVHVLRSHLLTHGKPIAAEVLYQRGDDGTQGRYAPALFRRRDHNLRIGGGVFAQRFFDLFKDLGAFGFFDLVALGQNHLKSHRRTVEQRHNFVVDLFDPMARVDQHESAAQGLTARQVLFQQPLPFFDHGQGGIGIAVAGKVDEVVLFASRKKVYLLRTTWRVGGPRERLHARQCVN